MTKTYTAAEIRENRQKWAAALRSGEWPQGRNALRSGTGGYCCIGVACEVVAGIKLSRNCDPADGYDAVDAACGLNGSRRDRLVSANDDDGKSFLQIADMVDALPDPEAK